MKKLINILLGMQLLSSGYVYACTSLLIGRDISLNGEALIARTSDTSDARRAKNLQLYYSSNDGEKSYIGLPYWDLENDQNNDMAQVTSNKYGVSISATETIQSNSQSLSLDPAVYNLGVSEPNIPALLMPTATSASDAVDLLLSDISTMGVNDDWGFGVLITDKSETWYVETLSGHQAIAIKIPNNSYFVAANGPGQIQQYDITKYTYKMTNFNNMDPISFATTYQIAKL